MTRKAKSKPSPNATVAAATADIRVFWPANTGNLQAALDALDLAYGQVKRKILEQEQ